MAKIPVLRLHGTGGLKDTKDERVHLPSTVEVKLVPDTPTVLLAIEENGYTAIYPLSLPTALRLAEGLRQAVCVYLRGPETE